MLLQIFSRKALYQRPRGFASRRGDINIEDEKEMSMISSHSKEYATITDKDSPQKLAGVSEKTRTKRTYAIDKQETLPLKKSSEESSKGVESNMEPVLEEMKIDDVEIDKVCVLGNKHIYLYLKILIFS